MAHTCRGCGTRVSSSAAWCSSCGQRVYTTVGLRPLLVGMGAAAIGAVVLFVWLWMVRSQG